MMIELFDEYAEQEFFVILNALTNWYDWDYSY